MTDFGVRARRSGRFRLFVWLVALTIAAGLWCGRFGKHAITPGASLAAPAANASAGEAQIPRVDQALAGAS